MVAPIQSADSVSNRKECQRRKRERERESPGTFSSDWTWEKEQSLVQHGGYGHLLTVSPTFILVRMR